MFIKIILNNNKNVMTLSKSGFTLVEALVSISILMVAIAGPMTIAQKSLSSAILSKDQMTASFLAQDGLEAVKNLRDQVVLNSALGDTDWLSGLSDCICIDENECNLDNLSLAKYCNIDTTLDNLTDIDAIRAKGENANPLLFLTDSETGNFVKYGLSAGNLGSADSKFSRYINIRQSPNNDNPNEAVVTVRIVWNSATGEQHVEIKNFIYNYSANIETEQ